MIGIYKITNLINQKSYIGQSVHIERRWAEHKNKNNQINQKQLYRAFKKYGLENFSFEVIEECLMTELNEKEKYWILKYNTLTPNGYNVADDTNTIHSTYRFFNKDVLYNIILDLKNTSLSLKDIGLKYNLSIGTISRINSGQIHYQDNELYPIRQTNWNRHEELKICKKCGKPISLKATYCRRCSAQERTIPLEEMPVTREELKNLIRTTPFTTIGKKYNVTDNAIKKWCDKFNLPRVKKEIKQYSDTEWDNI